MAKVDTLMAIQEKNPDWNVIFSKYCGATQMACGFMKLLPIDLILTYMKRTILLKGQNLQCSSNPWHMGRNDLRQFGRDRRKWLLND